MHECTSAKSMYNSTDRQTDRDTTHAPLFSRLKMRMQQVFLFCTRETCIVNDGVFVGRCTDVLNEAVVGVNGRTDPFS